MSNLPMCGMETYLDPSVTVVYYVGKVHESGYTECQGIFSTREKADSVATGHDDYFVGPMPLDHEVPYGTLPCWPGAYHPDFPGIEPTTILPP